ncbi:hypothetical protein V8C37DRAFT_376325 [Trichoderma ceciliae]
MLRRLPLQVAPSAYFCLATAKCPCLLQSTNNLHPAETLCRRPQIGAGLFRALRADPKAAERLKACHGLSNLTALNRT